MTIDVRIAAFFASVVTPAFTELAASPRITRGHEPLVIADAIDDPLHAALIAELYERAPGRIGPVLVIARRGPRALPFGGMLLVAAAVNAHAVAMPVTMFQRRIERRLVCAAQRYDRFTENHLPTITPAMVRAHALASFATFLAAG